MQAQAPHTLLEWILAGAGGATLIVFAVALQNFFVQPPALTASGARGGEYEEFRKRTWRMIPFAY